MQQRAVAERPQFAPSHRGTRAVQHLVEHAPSTGGLALWVLHQDIVLDVSGIPTPIGTPVSTDGHTLRYTPAFEKLALPLQAGWVAHEVLHIALRHAPRFADLQQHQGDTDLRLFNTCADAIVNSALAHLPWLQLPAGALRLETLLNRVLGLDVTPEAALAAWDVERLYRAIDDRRAPFGNAKNKDGQGGDATAPTRREDGPRAASTRALGAAHASDLQPRAHAQDAPEAQAEQAREWAERLQRAHANDGVFSMLRTLLADLPRSRTPWEQSLRVQLARGLAPKRSLSWSRPTRSYLANQGRAGPRRRMPWEPGHSATTPVPRLVVVVDVSGSIADSLMARFAREIEALTRRLEAGLVLVVGDDAVREVLHFKPGDFKSSACLQGITFHGGGGTDFTPLLQEAERHRPDLTVVLTDLEGPALFRPRAPVLWAVPEAHAHQQQPFGRKLVLS